MNQPEQLHLNANSQALPADAPELLAELQKNQLSEEAKLHLRAFAKFYLWADPLFGLGHIKIKERIVMFDSLVAKRFMIGLGADGFPKIEVQEAEMSWMNVVPWLMAGVHFSSNRIFLFTSPATPLAGCAFVIPIDVSEKLDCFKDKKYLTIGEAASHLGGHQRKVTLELKVVDDEFFERRRRNIKM
ncbi:hypothetical protein ACKF11_13740 [Methylobacillus sp. Pita2]|uniref:hypothetical protein n=1 Tax=Methylobacillus sp. Pita2 TaxID=3383245 RepID=UPI0038B5DB2A